jgi:murein DD-endopeptidase / murein LD-carboxypeptidase
MILNYNRIFNSASLTRMAGVASLALLLIGQTGCQSTTVAERYTKPEVSTVYSQEQPQKFAQEEVAPEIGDSYEDPSFDLERYRDEVSRFSVDEYAAQQKMYEQIQQLVGTRYRYGGTDEDRGLDCSGFVSKVFGKSLGMRLPHSSTGMAELGADVSKSELQFGDLVFFKIKRNRISHVGIYVGEGKFVHATKGLGVTYSSLDEDYYRRTYARSKRLLN